MFYTHTHTHTQTHTHTHTYIYIHIYTMEYYSALKKNEILAFAGKWMEFGNIMLSEISQTPQKTKRLNVFSDIQKLIHNNGGR